MTPMEGTIVSHYKILEPLGGGGMGVVYKAEDIKLGRVVALKFLPRELTRSEDEAKERFMQEARAASALDHPNICTIYEIDETPDGRLFLAMACYDGETLKTRIQRGPLPVPDALGVAVQVAQGLVKAHAVDIVHRDVKPANLMVTTDGLVKILDFGLAKLLGQTALTQVGTTLGTMAYMSPQQALGRHLDQRTDIWSLGVVMYEMLTGQLPFNGETNATMSNAIMQMAPAPVTALRTGVPMDLERVVTRALSKDPADRYQTATDMLSELRRLKRETDSAQLEPTAASHAGTAQGRGRFTADTSDSDDLEYHAAIKSARERIWICQTWFPGVERDATEILQSNLSNVRILLSSFKAGSPIFARISGRKMKAVNAKANVESSVKLFVESEKQECLRFTYGHNPGWIAVIDSWVFWGPTPVNRDNHSMDFLFHKHPVSGPQGVFWVGQFELLWQSYSHDYEAEKEYNEELRELEI